MEGISDIKIVGVDPTRPAIIKKEPYIDLYFELSHDVPEEWAKDFNQMFSKHKFPAKVDANGRSFIETWVRRPDDIVEHYDLLKIKVSECNDAYIARVEKSKGQRSAGNSALAAQGGEQGRLNDIIAGLEFDD